MQSDAVFTVVTTEPVGGLRGGDQVRRVVEKAMPVAELKQNFDRFLGSLQDLVAGGEQRAGAFVLDEITFSAEIGAEGEFKLLGSGVTVSGASTVEFTMKRSPGGL